MVLRRGTSSLVFLLLLLSVLSTKALFLQIVALTVCVHSSCLGIKCVQKDKRSARRVEIHTKELDMIVDTEVFQNLDSIHECIVFLCGIITFNCKQVLQTGCCTVNCVAVI